MSQAIASKVRVGWLVTKSARQAAVARLYASRLFRWRFARAEPERLVLAPQDLRGADPTRATEIIEGRYSFAGKTLDLGMVSPFLAAPPSPAWSEALLGFTWLRHLRAADGAAGRATARRLIGEFVRSPVRFQSEALDLVITARRVLSWLSQAPLALEGVDRGFYRAFIRSLNWQMHYLVRAGGLGRDGLPRLLCAIAATQASLCLSERGAARRRATRRLCTELQRQVLADGGHVSRNPNAVIELLLDLLPLRQSFAARNIMPPQDLLGAIDRMMPMLRFFRHADGAIATFNGMGYTQGHLIATLLTYDDSRGRPLQNAPHSGYQRIDAGGSVLIVDAGRPPPVALSQDAHAGCLSFELSAGNARIVVNCGAPGSGRQAWREASRITAAHSTLVIGGRSSAAFAAARSLRRLIDQPILDGPHRVGLERREEEGAVTLALDHDGYRAAFGAIHQRELRLDQTSGALSGIDRLVTASGSPWRKNQSVVLRFHLHPLVFARPVIEEGTVVLTLPGGATWRFACEAGAVELAETIHFANPEGPRRATQIVVTLERGAEGQAVHWSFAPARSRG